MKFDHYSSNKLDEITVFDDSSIITAIQLMNAKGLRIVPVVSKQTQNFIGLLADGDIRRFIGNAGDLTHFVSEAVNKSPKFSDQPIELGKLSKHMNNLGVEALPIVLEGKLVEFHVMWPVSKVVSDLTVVIMAGGLGSRLAPLTDDCPKPLLELHGKPILTRIIEGLRDQGVSNFVLSVNYLADKIVSHYGDGGHLGVSIDYVFETKRLGTGGALSLVNGAKISEPFMVINGDIINDIDAIALREHHIKKSWSATMVARDYNYTVPYGVIQCSEDGEFLGSEEKPTTRFSINAGVYMLSKDILKLIPIDQFYDLPTLFNDLRDQQKTCGTYSHSGRWIDIGSISELERAEKMFQSEEGIQ